MKRLTLLMALLLLAGTAYAQNSYMQLFRDNGSGASGSTWAASATHRTEFVDMIDYDSAWVVFEFTDTVDVDIYILSYATRNSSIADTSSRVDSLYAQDSNGKLFSKRTHASFIQGSAGFRVRLAFASDGNDTGASEKYRIWVRKYRKDRPTPL